MRLPAKQEPKAVVIAEPIIAQIISAQPNFPLAVENPFKSTHEIRATANMGLGMFQYRTSKLETLYYPNAQLSCIQMGFGPRVSIPRRRNWKLLLM
jgi:hypothetical protein